MKLSKVSLIQTLIPEHPIDRKVSLWYKLASFHCCNKSNISGAQEETVIEKKCLSKLMTNKFMTNLPEQQHKASLMTQRWYVSAELSCGFLPRSIRTDSQLIHN